MKIGFLITYFYPQTGGAENNCYYLAKELAKKHEVHVFCSGKEDKNEIIDGIKVHRSKEIFRLKYYFAFYPGIIDSLLKHKLDILHIHGFGFLQHDIAISKLKKKYPKTKIVCTPHGPFMALNKYNIIGRIFKSFYTPFIKKSLRLYDTIIEVNPFQYSWMKKDYGIPTRKIRFVPNGISEESFNKINRKEKDKIKKEHGLEGKFVISYLGRIQKYKGVGQIIESLPEIMKEKENLVFIAMGADAGDMDNLKKRARKLGIEKNVIFTGKVSEKEKVAILDLSEIFIFPSEWEAFGIVVLEAMARGNAIVSSRTEGGRFLVGKKNGILFDYGDEKSLSNAIKKLIKDNKLIKSMREANLEIARKFIWKDIAKELEKVYGGLI